MKVSDFIVEYLVDRGITDVFGYPGGMVTHLMDSFGKYQEKILAHVVYHEQGAAFSACGYAQATGKVCVAYATSGPGATNLITGICNAYFDSIPVLFITGQVNTFESKGNLGVRQRGFQETEIVSMVKNVTKMSAYIEQADKIKYYLDKAFYLATNGRQGPVLLDIPMDILKSEIDRNELAGYGKKKYSCAKDETMERFKECIEKALKKAERPCFLIGNGVKQKGLQKKVKRIIGKFEVPVVSSMIAFDVISSEGDVSSDYFFGFIGAYGKRSANFILAKCDLVLTLGSRLDVRQVGADREAFAPNAEIIRIDVDYGEMTNKVHKSEKQFLLELTDAISVLEGIDLEGKKYKEWLKICKNIQEKVENQIYFYPNLIMEKISALLSSKAVVTTDVGQNQVWTAQSFKTSGDQLVLFSGGHGAMGYALPAAIGAYYGKKKPVACISGDGGFQMNIQEMEFIAREKLPIKMIIFNNCALGMIRHFQEMYFHDRYVQTVPKGGYESPDFCAIAKAYGIKCRKVLSMEDLPKKFCDEEPELIEIMIEENTYVFPKVKFGNPNQDQEPLIDRALYKEIMEL
ncbi:thiamine pyrophosphate-binding protein [Lacrimispora sp. NSJ-141]|uniref:Thiamine pyrophosphate-binding protein n=1 Tax=Lientehia hominis TaxID=2897778 RepID=A0AAP2W8P3_9FIRM|nr:thiamine pyrophosphate-binding protein [Lientehia hominis]MCD2492281.1 thiamine pyrophosphate-binding protein [Lientehia hominis]